MASSSTKDAKAKLFDGVLCLPQLWSAKALGVSTARFRQLEIEPHAVVGKSPWYSLDSLFVKWAERSGYSRGAESGLDTKEKLELLKIRELELDLAEREGTLVQFSASQDALDAAMHELGAVFDGLPHSVAHECAGRSAEEIVGILKVALDSARAVIAQIQAEVPELPSDAVTGQGLNGHGVV